jgi:hypothetical protein
MIASHPVDVLGIGLLRRGTVSHHKDSLSRHLFFADEQIVEVGRADGRQDLGTP